MIGSDATPAFEGLRIVDLTQGLAGPFCAMLMAQNGAEVVKVEPPEGDWSRSRESRPDQIEVRRLLLAIGGSAQLSLI